MYNILFKNLLILNKIIMYRFLLKPAKLNNIAKRLYSTKNYYITPTLEWVNKIEDNIYHIGISQEASSKLGEIVYLDYLDDIDDIIEKGDILGHIESSKAVAEIISPFDCKIIENNLDILDNYEILNEEAENLTKSWLIKIKKNI